MADSSKKVNIEINSNLKQVLAGLKDLNNRFAKTNELNIKLTKHLSSAIKDMSKSAKDVETSSKKSLSVVKEIEKAEKRIEESRKRSAAQTKKRYENEISSLNAMQSQFKENYGLLKSGNISGFIKSNFNFGIDNTIIKPRIEAREKLRDERIESFDKSIDKEKDKISGYKEDLKKLKDTKENSGKIADLQKKIFASENKITKATEAKSKELGESAKDIANLQGKGVLAKAGADMVISTLSKMGKTVAAITKDITGMSLSIKDNFREVVGIISNMMDKYEGAGTYATGTSIFMNAKAREQQMKYGLSNAQNYALSQTMTLLNLKSDEDLMYMNQTQVTKFNEFMNKYSNWYNQLQSSGVLAKVQNFQLEFEMFKQELAMDFMNWFADNKDTLMDAIKTTVEVLKAILTVVMNITKGISQAFGNAAALGWGKSNDLTSGIDFASAMKASDYTTYNSTSASKTVNINVNQSNTATGVLSNQSAMENYFGDQMKKLAQELAVEID